MKLGLSLMMALFKNRELRNLYQFTAGKPGILKKQGARIQLAQNRFGGAAS